MNAKEVIKLEKARGYKKLKKLFPEQIEALEKAVYKHYSICENWNNGKAKRVFIADRLLAVEYECGKWWHYAGGEWF